MGPATLEATGRGPDAATSPGHRPEDGEKGAASERDAGGTATTSGGGGGAAAAANLARPPPPSLLPTSVKPKKRKRKDASGPTGPAPGTGDCRDLIYGAGARAAVELRPIRFIRLQDIQNLVLWVLGEGSNPSKWAFVKNKALVERVLLVAVPGLDAETWRAHRAALPRLGSGLGEPVTLLAQRADVWQSQSVRALFSVPETRKTKAARTQAGGPGSPPAAPPPHPPSFYRLTGEQLKICEFPALDEDGGVPPGFIVTQPRSGDGGGGGGGAHHHPLVALDCEMCETASGFEVTRVSLVDGEGGVLLDELVSPDAPIIEYHTRYSGITAAMLAGVTTTLADVQARLLAHLSADTLLVGHGLENDLKALRIVHTAIIDTSVLFPHPRGLPCRTALRRLASTFLKKAIQGGEHDSVEDARVALALARLKFRHGPAYGVEAPDKGEKLCAVLEAAGRSVSLVDRAEALNRVVGGRAAALPAATDREAAAKAAREVGAPRGGPPHFVWTQLGGLDALQRGRAEAKRGLLELHAQRRAAGEVGEAERLPPLHDGSEGAGGEGGGGGGGGPAAGGGGGGGARATADEATTPDAAPSPPPPPPSPPPPPPDPELAAVLTALDAHVDRLHAAAPPNTLVIVTTCQGDTHDTRRLQQQAYRRAQGLDGLPPWSPECEGYLDRLKERGMQGLCWVGVKE